MMKKVIVHAYTQLNLGDDLFIKILLDRYPNTRFILYAPKKYRKIFRNYPNVKIINSENLLRRGVNFIGRFLGLHNAYRFHISKKYDGSILIGGSLFIESNPWLAEFKNKMEMKIENKPFFILGCNFGPFSNQNFYLKHKQLFSEATDVCFRDSNSYKLFSHLPQVRKSPDIVFTYKNHLRRKNKHNKLILISVIKPSIREKYKNIDEAYFNKMKDLCMHLVENNYEVCLVSFCDYEEDPLAISKIKSLLPKRIQKMIKVQFYTGNITEILSLFSRAQFVIASRFHSMILGWIYECSVFPIIYSSKMTNVLKDIQFKGDYVNLGEIEYLKIKKVLKALESNYITVDRERMLAEDHFKKLDDFLNK